MQTINKKDIPEILTVEIEKLSNLGLGIARIEGYVIFAESACPGDIVKIRVGKKNKNFAEAKIIEIINKQEVETQGELVKALKDAGFNVTQATISRDIKELCLFKIAGETKKYKYAFVDSEDKNLNSKTNEIYRNVVLSIHQVLNQVVVRVLKGTAEAVAGVAERMSIATVLGIIAGSDTVLIITDGETAASEVADRLQDLLNNNN